MSIFFGGLGHFFKSLFGENADGAQKVLHDVSSFTSLAEPIVLEIEAELKASVASDPFARLGAVLKFLQKYEPSLEKAQATASLLSGLPAAELWHSLAVVALTTVVPSGTAASLLNLAVEFAYNIVKARTTVAVA